MEIRDIDLENKKIQSGQDAYEIIRKIFFERHEKSDFLKEHFWAIALNKGSAILCVELVSIGSNGRVIVSPSEVLRVPIYKGASRLVLAHNHPSGTLKPSDSDLDTTNRLIQAALLVDVEIIDHVIVTERSYYSFRDGGLIEKLRWNNKYALSFVREKQVEKQMEMNRKKDLNQIAMNLLAQGVSRQKIEKATKLTPQHIGRLAKKLKLDQ